jgi:peptidoglycan/xylan/chitin deacetylase (PgdA/CDA1 family)
MDQIDVAVTFDVERDPTIRDVIPRLVELFDRYDAVGTWFLKHDETARFTDYTGRVAEDFPNIVADLADVGEIGTHIHFRNQDGDFSMDAGLQRELLETATDALRSQGYEATSFRGGNLCADATTLSILEELGYQADSSILPGHYRQLPDGVVVDHRGAARNLPYTPARSSHVARGDLDLLEVPVSSLLPFESVSVGRSLTGLYNRAVEREPLDRFLPAVYRLWGRTSGAPVVLLFHDHEFSLDDGSLDVLERFCRTVSDSSRFRFATIGEIANEWSSS